MVKTRKKRLVVHPDFRISERVRERMKDTEVGQKGLAELLNISEGYLSRILSNHRPWTIDLLLKSAAALSCQVEDLDPNCVLNLKDSLLAMELRGDVAQLRAIYTFIQSLPNIRSSADLDALTQVVRAFALRETRAA